MMKSIFKRVKYTTIEDWFSIILFIIALPISYILKLKHPHLWLICEDKNEARDNGYWFFKYVREKHPEQDVAYAINKKSPDYVKVSNLGKVISYGTLTHWVYYLAAEQNISSQKGGKPNAAFCYFLEVYGIWKNSRVFLQHGITKDDARWLYYNATKIKLFICGAKPEYDFIVNKFGYPKDNVKYTGFARFDNLHDIQVKENRILIMPSWREWLTDVVSDYDGNIEIGKKFTETEYFIKWNEFLNSEEIHRVINENKLNVIFYPHRNMQKFLEYFNTDNENIVIASGVDWDVQELLKNSALLITDYSSVFFDFIYMRKPVIFYQFDYEMFRKYQYKEGWFDYKKNDVGYRCTEYQDVVDRINIHVEGTYKNSNCMSDVFPLYDKNNSERIYTCIDSLQKR